MKTTILIDNACNCLEKQLFTKSSIYINYRWHWNRFIKSIYFETEFNLQSINNYLIHKCGRNLLLEDPSVLPVKEYRIRHAFHSLIYYFNYQSMPGTSMEGSSIRKKLSNFDKICLDSYMEHIKELEYSPNSQRYAYNTVHTFLTTCSLLDISDGLLLQYFYSLSDLSKQTVKSKLKVLKRFLVYCNKKEYIYSDYSPLFPSNKHRNHTEIPSVYTPEEIFQLLDYIRYSGGINPKRNYAIALLIALYGFRAGDIWNMKISDIDWESETICIVQSKTKQLLTHKFNGYSGNALTDYLLNKRSAFTSEKVFLKADGSELGSAVTISTMISNAFISSGININGRKHGSHSLRHSLASNMLSNDTGIMEISKTLGHASVDTTRIYSKVDFNHLRLCELEVPTYE
ncbi:tyrosine-type recombinase/integrase [Gracilibacillus alcaliphilus]|uniref:tyrosine-type recombinase/integrase n=1 Tax=Gracilibacillus alcaliphilus TaxID=1401441 RepID=UPI00195BA078|nr:tyrosine-type recombinase/integrase [Gracilibacillus alcaliphilus]MBM7678041.1 integrase [Gracilibacillus alcaliphilus]